MYTSATKITEPVISNNLNISGGLIQKLLTINEKKSRPSSPKTFLDSKYSLLRNSVSAPFLELQSKSFCFENEKKLNEILVDSNSNIGTLLNSVCESRLKDATSTFDFEDSIATIEADQMEAKMLIEAYRVSENNLKLFRSCYLDTRKVTYEIIESGIPPLYLFIYDSIATRRQIYNNAI